MRIILRPGHGITPPAGKAKPIDYSPGESGHPLWSRQRPGNREDDYTAKFSGKYLIPALLKAGHDVYPLRALDPVTGKPDTTVTEVGPATLAGLTEDQTGRYPRWLYNASVEGAIRGLRVCRDWAGDPWVYDPVSACRWEHTIPDTRSQEMYLSIHQNWWHSPTVFGCNVMHCENSRVGRSLALGIYGEIVQSFAHDEWTAETRLQWGHGRLTHRLQTGSRWGCSGSRLWELRATRRPAVLIELAFASNPDDNDRMNDPDWCGMMAQAIAKGI